MKKLVLLLIVFCSIFLISVDAQVKPALSDTSKKDTSKATVTIKIDGKLSNIKAGDTTKKVTQVASSDTINKKTTTKSLCDTCNIKICKPGKLASGGAWWLVFSPIILFLGLLVYLLTKLKGFELADAISENEYVKVTIPNLQYTGANLIALGGTAAAANISIILPPTIDVTNTPAPGAPLAPPTPPRPSSSRFIALITSMLTLVIALCLSSFYIYFYIATGVAPDISKFSSVLLALGVGVVPYAFNKVASAITNKPSTPEQ